VTQRTDMVNLREEENGTKERHTRRGGSGKPLIQEGQTGRNACCQFDSRQRGKNKGRGALYTLMAGFADWVFG